MFSFNEYLQENRLLFREISLAFELIEDEQIPIDNMFDSICEARLALVHIYGYEF